MAKKAGMATGVEVARISVKVSPDTKGFRGELQRELNEIERTMSGDVKINAHVESAQARADFKRMMEQMRSDGAKGVKIKTNTVNGSSEGGGGGRSPQTGGVDDDANRLTKLFNNLKNKLTQAPNFGSGINLTGYLVILTALATVLAPLAGLITALLLALPGLISLVLTPIAAVTLGLEGLKEAAKTLEQPFQELKDIMSGAVKEQFTPVFETLRGIFPTLKASLPTVSQGLADMAQAVAGVATSPAGMKMIEDIIRGIGSALTAAAPGIGSLTAGLLKLTDSFVNGGALSGLTSWFNEAMASFSQWISKMQATGQLDAIFQSLGAVLKVVMDTLGAIAQIGLDTLTDPEAMLAFMAILKGVGAALVFFFAASKSFLNAVGVLAINAALFFGQLAATITSVVTAIAGFAVQLASKFQTAWATLVQYAVAAWNGVVNAVSSAVATIVGIVSSVGSTISGIWNGITAAASGAWNGVVSAISAAWAAIVSTIQGAISTVLGIVSGWGSSIIGVITSIDLAGAGRALIQRFIDGVKGMAGAVVGAVKSVFGGIMSLIPRSPAKDGPFAQSGWNNLRLGGQAVAQQFGDGMTNGFEGVLGEAKSMAGKIADVFSSGGDPTGLLSGLDNKQVNTMEKTLSFEAKRLGLQAKALDYQSKTTGNAALKARADEIRAQQEQITMQKEMLDLTQEYADLQNPGSGARSDNPFLASIQELMKLPSGFGSATANQAMQDLNISGDGALQAIAGFGMDFAKKGVTNIFNTSNVDDTLALHFNQTNRQAQGVVGR